MKRLRPLIVIPIVAIIGVGHWTIAAPPRRQRSPLSVWSIRLATAVFLVWLFALGPAGLLAPRLAGFALASTGDVKLYHQNEVPRVLVEDALRCAQTALARNLTFWGRPEGGIRPFNIYLCNTRARFRQLALWPGGNACAIGRTIFVSPLDVPSQANLDDVLTHEMCHAFLNQRLGLRAYAVPQWMNEGVATYLGQNFWATQESLRQNLEHSTRPELIPASELMSLLEWGNGIEDPLIAALTYGHAQSLCDYLIDRFGSDTVKSFFDNVSLFDDADVHFHRVFGMPIAEADRAWLAEAKLSGQIPLSTVLANRPATLKAFVFYLIPFAFLACGFLWLIRLSSLLIRFAARQIGPMFHEDLVVYRGKLNGR